MDDEGITDAALRARRGEPEAAARFVRLTQQHVWRLLVHLADRAVAEDLAQETYERAFGALPRFRAESSALTWLLSIARRVAADHVRGKARRPAVARPITEDDEPVSAPRRGDLSEGVALRRVVDALDPQRREAFVLTQMLGLNYADAAQVCGCPVGTIRSRVARARADLIESLGIDVPDASAEQDGPGAGGAR